LQHHWAEERGKKRKNHEDWDVPVDLPYAAELVEEVNGAHPVLAGEVDEARGTRCCSMRPSAAFPWRGPRRSTGVAGRGGRRGGSAGQRTGARRRAGAAAGARVEVQEGVEDVTGKGPDFVEGVKLHCRGPACRRSGAAEPSSSTSRAEKIELLVRGSRFVHENQLLSSCAR
jgi:hypothetical protein